MHEAQRHVEVRAGQGAVEGLVRVNRQQEGLTLGEAQVVFEERALPSLRGVLHADAHLGPRAVEPLVHDALEDPVVDVLDARRSPVPVVWGS